MRDGASCSVCEHCNRAGDQPVYDECGIKGYRKYILNIFSTWCSDFKPRSFYEGSLIYCDRFIQRSTWFKLSLILYREVCRAANIIANITKRFQKRVYVLIDRYFNKDYIHSFRKK